MSSEQNQHGHSHHDGIEELDNVLPAWWLFTFFGTIIFGFVYFVHYQSGSGPTTQQELETSLAQIKSLKKGEAIFSEDKLLALFTEDLKHSGQEVFKAKCVACHGPEGGGLIGPNLTDKSWISGQGTRQDLFKIISHGVPEKGMPAWGEQMSENEVLAAASYVYSLKGTFVPNGKPAQGTEYP